MTNSEFIRHWYNGNLAKVKDGLLNSKFDPSYDNNFSIRRATEKGNIKVVELLLKDKRVDPSENDNFPISLAIKNMHLDVAN